MEIRPLDLDDDGSMSDAYFIEWAANQRSRPGWMPLPQKARLLGWRADDEWNNQLVGAWEGATLLGFAAAMNADDSPETTWIFVWVDPRSQNAGVGSALARAAEESCLPSTKRFVASVYRPTSAEINEFTMHFSEPMGYAIATTETVVELDLGASLPSSPRVAADYEVTTHVNGVPEQFRKQVGQIKGLVDAEAPNGDLGWGESTVTPAQYADELALWIAQGHTVVESIAVDSTGNVAAWTCLLATPQANRPSQIEGTLVVAAHRGRGLGAAVKLASLNRARQLDGVRMVRTSSDDQNTWMRSINTSLGFVPVETEIILQKERVSD